MLRKSPFENIPFYELIQFSYYTPAYQRDYGWNIKLCEGLLIDLKDKDIPFIEGQIVLFENVLRGLEIKEIVDGQQRITTTLLLFAAIYTNILEDSDKLWGDLEDIERDIVRMFNKRLSTNNNSKVIEILEESGLIIIKDKIRMNMTQRSNWEDFCVLFDEHQSKKVNVFNKLNRENPFIRNYEYFYKEIKNSKSESNFTDILNNIGNTMINIGYVHNDPVQRFQRLNQNKMAFKIEDFVKTLFFTTAGSFEADDKDEKYWLETINNIKIIQKEIGSEKQFTFDHMLNWYLSFKGEKYNKHLSGTNDVKSLEWDIIRKSLSLLIDDMGNKFDVLKDLYEYSEKFKNMVTDKEFIWNKHNVWTILDVNTIPVYNYFMPMYFEEKETQKKILKEILIPYVIRRTLGSERKIAQDMWLRVIVEFYEFMDKNKDLEIYEAYEQYFFYSDLENKMPTLNELRNIDLTIEKHSNISKIIQILSGVNNFTLEHIIPQDYIKNEEQFDDLNKNKLNGNFKSYSELKKSVYHLGNFAALSRKQNSSLQKKSPLEKIDVLDSNGVAIDKEFKDIIRANELNFDSIEKRGERLLLQILSMKEIQCKVN